MTPQEAQKLVKDGQAILVDVREEPELKESGIAEGAQWMPLSAMVEETEQWLAFKQGLAKGCRIILYCKVGGRSARMAECLCCEGFQAVNLGGFCEWKGAGLPVKPYGGKAG
jgi:rhodanese-related sulfurtransferase